MGRIKARGQDGNIHQILELPLFEALNQQIPVLQIGRARHQCCFVLRQIPGNLPRMLHRGSKDHHAPAVGGQLHHLLYNCAGNPLVLTQQLVNVFLGVLTKPVLSQRREIVLLHSCVHEFGFG